jgi:hypothetical protein
MTSDANAPRGGERAAANAEAVNVLYQMASFGRRP